MELEIFPNRSKVILKFISMVIFTSLFFIYGTLNKKDRTILYCLGALLTAQFLVLLIRAIKTKSSSQPIIKITNRELIFTPKFNSSMPLSYKWKDIEKIEIAEDRLPGNKLWSSEVVVLKLKEQVIERYKEYSQDIKGRAQKKAQDKFLTEMRLFGVAMHVDYSLLPMSIRDLEKKLNECLSIIKTEET